jgi:hypothetical protein
VKSCLEPKGLTTINRSAYSDYNGTTGTNGAVAVQSNNVRSAKSGTTFTFTITAVTKTGYTLDPTKSEMSDSVTK